MFIEMKTHWDPETNKQTTELYYEEEGGGGGRGGGKFIGKF